MTGGAQGIGKAIVDILDIKKVTVVVLDIAVPEKGSSEYNDVHFYQCDVSDAKQVSQIAQKIKAEVSKSLSLSNAGTLTFIGFISTARRRYSSTMQEL